MSHSAPLHTPRAERLASERRLKCLACGSAGRVRKIECDHELFAVCRSCGNQWLAFTPKIITETVQYNYYMDTRSYQEPAGYPPFVDFFTFLGKQLPGPYANILDVGCGAGIFLSEASRRGHRVTGIEADEKLAKRLPVAIADRVIFSRAECVKSFPEAFNVITFWDSFEHFSHPFDLLDYLKRFLKPGGLFYVRTNNNFDVFNLLSQILLLLYPSLGEKIFAECFNRRSVHLWNFSQKGLSRILRQGGYRIINYGITETPAFRLTESSVMRGIFNLAYLVNRVIGGGKVAEVYLTPVTPLTSVIPTETLIPI